MPARCNFSGLFRQIFCLLAAREQTRGSRRSLCCLLLNKRLFNPRQGASVAEDPRRENKIIRAPANHGSTIVARAWKTEGPERAYVWVGERGG
jgi:hypothetical protein